VPRFAIQSNSGIAPSEQIAEQIRFAIAAETFGPGDRLPSVRQLAAEILVNPNTVAKAYRQLEWERIVEGRAGEGVFVASGADELCVASRDRVLRDRLARLLEEARGAGLDPDELWVWFESKLSSWREGVRT
jgi:GntR family transcriptional regulator